MDLAILLMLAGFLYKLRAIFIVAALNSRHSALWASRHSGYLANVCMLYNVEINRAYVNHRACNEKAKL